MFFFLCVVMGSVRPVKEGQTPWWGGGGHLDSKRAIPKVLVKEP
jgi:hypothetical protein